MKGLSREQIKEELRIFMEKHGQEAPEEKDQMKQVFY